MFRRLSFLICLLFMSGVSMADARLFAMEEFYLDNGLRVIVINNAKAPIVKQMLWYKAGSIDEPLGKGGTAHLLEHLMFRGTEKISGSDFNKILEKNGADVNAFTAQDVTSYHALIDVSRLELALLMEADRMNGLHLTPENFALERDIVYQERMQVVENNPSAPFKENLQRALWQNHPYARPITGEAEEILSLTQKDVEDFYRRFYSPENAVLVLSGDVTAAEAKPLVEKYFAGAGAKKEKAETPFPELPKETKAYLQMKLPHISLPSISKNYAAPSWGRDKEKVFLLAVFSRYLGETEISYLHKKLVEEKKLALSVNSSYNPYARSYGSFSINAIPAPGVSPEELSKALDEEINEALKKMNIEALQQTKKRMLADLVYLNDNPADAAYIAGMMASLGLPLQEISDYENNLQKTNLSEIKEAVGELLTQAPFAEGILLPEEGHGA